VAAEDEERVQEHLVATVPEDELLRLHAVALRERRRQVRARGCGGIAVQKDVVELRWRQVQARRVRLGPLVGIDPDLRGHLLGPVCLERLEVGARPGQTIAHVP